VGEEDDLGFSFLIESMNDSIVFFSMFRISSSVSASSALRMPARMMSEGQKTRSVIFDSEVTGVFFFSMLISSPFAGFGVLEGLSIGSPAS